MDAELSALAFLIVLGALAIGGLVGWLRRRPYTFAQSVLWLLALLLVRILWRARIPAHLPIPEGQGAVIVANHRSSVDPFFIQVVAPRAVHWMVAREYCEHWAFRWFLRTCEVIPVSRGGIDTAATKQAIRLARGGGLIGMLPEGRINMTEQFMLPARPGAAAIALKAQVPIVPCYIEGSPYDGRAWSPLLMPARVRVRFGEPIPPPAVEPEGENEQVAHFMREVLRAIARLAERPDVQPQLAGRAWKPTREEVDEHARRQRQRGRTGR